MNSWEFGNSRQLETDAHFSPLTITFLSSEQGSKKEHLKPKHGICDTAFCLKNKKDDLQVLGC